ncbi:MAG: hypothetical protein PHT38_08185 [Halothiobacillus sp.]|nr:hypothetical protein [Halothiobacillus sp.]
MNTLFRRGLVIGILGLTVLVYWVGLGGGFKFDDFQNLVDNPSFAPNALAHYFWTAVWSSDASAFHRPLTMLTFALQVVWTGMTPEPMKIANLLIHLLNGALIYFLAKLIFNKVASQQLNSQKANPWLISPNTMAILLMAAWLLSPMQLTAVLFVIQRMESLAVFFVLLGLLGYWHGRTRLLSGKPSGWLWLWGSLLLGTIFATAAKETGVMLPVYAFLLEWVLFRWAVPAQEVGQNTFSGLNKGKLGLVLLFTVILFLPGIGGLWYTLPAALNGSAYSTRPFSLAERLWTEGRILLDYIQWLVLPTQNSLSLFHDDILISKGWFAPWTTAASWIAIFALLTLAIVVRKTAPLFALGILWFFAGHALVSTYIPLELVYEHRNYLPSFGIYLAVFSVLFSGRLCGNRLSTNSKSNSCKVLLVGAAIALVAWFAFMTALRAYAWSTPFRLAYYEVMAHPDSPRANQAWAAQLMNGASDFNAPAVQLGIKTLIHAADLPQSGLTPVQSLILISGTLVEPVNPAWWQQLNYKITSKPLSTEDVGALTNLVRCQAVGQCNFSQTDLSMLAKSIKLAAHTYPNRADILTVYARYLMSIAHDDPTALGVIEKTIVLAPKKFAYRKNLMAVQLSLKDYAAAAKTLQKLKQMDYLHRHTEEIKIMENALKQEQ